jgi:hypothetical protein
LPVFRFDKISDIARGVKAFLSPEGLPRDAAPGVEQAEDPKNARKGMSERRKTQHKKQEFARAQRQKIKSKKWELSQIKKEAPAEKDWTEPVLVEHRKRKKRVQQEIFELERELRAVKERGAAGEEPETGALPDFIIIGATKGGTTFLYHLLSQHRLVEPAAAKELHFFDVVFDLGVEWYRRCFPTPRWKDGRKTITGEATPAYITRPEVPERMAEVVSHARLIALLRNPVDRAYSEYQHQVRKGVETLKFEEATEAEEARMRSERDKMLEDEHLAGFQGFSYLSRGVYVEQLLRWSEFFSREQMLVLKSEDFFERPQETLKTILEFLDLPDRELGASELGNKLNKGGYEQEMDPATRRRLEAFFEPHNRRLYDYLGKDFGW